MTEVIGGTAGIPPRAAAWGRWALRTGVFLLLAGLWVMHGMSGSTDAGCHGAPMPIPGDQAAMTTAMAAAPARVMPASPSPSGRAQTAWAGSVLGGQMQHGELCVSGQPPTPGQDLLVLLALLALLALAAYGVGGGSSSRLRSRAVYRAAGRAPPSLSGIRLLTSVCVSRT